MRKKQMNTFVNGVRVLHVVLTKRKTRMSLTNLVICFFRIEIDKFILVLQLYCFVFMRFGKGD